jgi:hypothetical protein
MTRFAPKALTGVLVLAIAGAAFAAPAAPPTHSVPAQAAPAPSARAILKMALDAPRLIDYEGTKIITALRNGQMETVTGQLVRNGCEAVA